MKKGVEKTRQPGSGKRERYIQPSILMGLCRKASYGYELIHSLQEFGFVKGEAPPGMVYRHLRQLEENGLVVSEWITEGAGPAKRMYRLTQEGREVLALWVEHMAAQAARLDHFVRIYGEMGHPPQKNEER
ncbi:MAG: helix-turn-helix transcriptional regulator [Desulfobacterales bacterium]|jgi:poly-beta-hydroxybutyrate-responsive repressor